MLSSFSLFLICPIHQIDRNETVNIPVVSRKSTRLLSLVTGLGVLGGGGGGGKELACLAIGLAREICET